MRDDCSVDAEWRGWTGVVVVVVLLGELLLRQFVERLVGQRIRLGKRR
jgi:hypothetical protein